MRPEQKVELRKSQDPNQEARRVLSKKDEPALPRWSRGPEHGQLGRQKKWRIPVMANRVEEVSQSREPWKHGRAGPEDSLRLALNSWENRSPAG